jgi:hypothetical protein
MWCGDQTLEEAFLDLNSIALAKDAFIAYHLVLSSDYYQWNITFIRAAHN